jgi:hypothetical protein
MEWTYRIPSRFSEQVKVADNVENMPDGWLKVTISLTAAESVSLIKT